MLTILKQIESISLVTSKTQQAIEEIFKYVHNCTGKRRMVRIISIGIRQKWFAVRLCALKDVS